MDNARAAIAEHLELAAGIERLLPQVERVGVVGAAAIVYDRAGLEDVPANG